MRLQHVDIARGLCILLVAWGHNMVFAPPDSAFNDALRLIRMPLLFFIAGTLFDPRGSTRQLLLHKADALLKPFLVIAALQAPFRLSLFSASPTEYALGTLSCSGNYLPWLYTLWFLPHLWAVFVFSHGTLRLTRMEQRHPVAQGLMLTMLLSAGCLVLPLFWRVPLPWDGQRFELLGLPFSMDLTLVSSAFFLAGYLARQEVGRLGVQPLHLVLALAAFACAKMAGAPLINLYSRVYQDPLWATVGAAAGIAFVLHMACGLQRLPVIGTALMRCGKESLFILIFHSPIQSLVIKAGQQLQGAPEGLVASVAYACCIAGSLVMAHVIRRHHWLSVWFLPIKSLKPRSRTQPAFADTEVMPHRA